MKYRWHEIITDTNVRYMRKLDVVNMLRLISYEDPVCAKYPEVQKSLKEIADIIDNTN